MTEPSAEMVEAAAKSLYEWGVDDWDTTLERIRDEYRKDARAALAAALSVGEVREEWEVYGDPGSDYPPYRFTWPDRPTAAAFVRMIRDGKHQSWRDGPHLQHRVIWTSPWTAVPNEEKTDGYEIDATVMAVRDSDDDLWLRRPNGWCCQVSCDCGGEERQHTCDEHDHFTTARLELLFGPVVACEVPHVSD